ncbi:hypothetical protein QBC35DRAFT_455514 [Podospora australis]|uniref:Uncharacterized protein n=1 Tax=Podospora australis TaxID=1536484 RepID=A0AAN7AFR4_9PEZI|nr:hypothetical protein QBC35DRAFT_455514 [Podospora australis]
MAYEHQVAGYRSAAHAVTTFSILGITRITQCVLVSPTHRLPIRHPPTRPRDGAWLAVRDGPFGQCQQVLERIKKKAEKREGAKGLAASLLWPFTKEEVAELLASIERLKTLLLVALELDYMKLSQAIKETVDDIRSSNKDILIDTWSIKNSLPAIESKVDDIDQNQHREAVLAWLPFYDFSVQQSDILAKLRQGSGQ